MSTNYIDFGCLQNMRRNKMKKFIGLFFITFTFMSCGEIDLLQRIKLGDDYFKLQLSPTEIEETLHKAQSGTYAQRKEALERLKNTLYEFDTVEKRTQTLLVMEILKDVYDSSNTELKNTTVEAMESIVTQSKKSIIIISISSNPEIQENHILQSEIMSLESIINSHKSSQKKTDKSSSDN